MTHLARQHTEHAQPVFTDAAKFPVRCKAKKPPPFSLRLNAEERQRLETAAAGMPLGSFIKARLFDGDLLPAARVDRLRRKTMRHWPGYWGCSVTCASPAT
ncbi:hypothetical protein [Celeribacter indicus]|uniref:hypothetical protein n=1 Tax=Celeribacter indicus TaxID=1208324 RepID=UPI000894638B|nr:hypothetical protein [Celeribacter indicus]SDW55183.1 hypothetical protein SAMN05443573_104221 [Celeribacter indicus]